MKKAIISFYLIIACLVLTAQEWTIPIITDKTWGFNDVVTIDERDFVLGIGCNSDENGFVAKISKDGEYIDKTVHLPGMVLRYHSAVQLDNGNYMVFGICEDSLCNPDFQRYIRVDIFNSDLVSVASKMYCVDDETFDCFAYPQNGLLLKPILSPTGNIILASAPSYYVEQYGYYQRALQFYELDQNGEIINAKSAPTLSVSSISKIAYEHLSDNVLIAINGGSFPSCSGCPGIYAINNALDIIEKQHLIHIQGGNGANVDNIIEISTDGKWIDDNFMLFSMKRSLHNRSFTYVSLYKLDSALNVYANLRLPPYDSCTWMPNGTSTTYINGSTIFAFTYSAESMLSFDTHQVNVFLVDENLNLLGRKTIKKDGVFSYVGPPSILNDDACIIPLYTSNGTSYPGEPFFQGYMVKFRREDIEITWDVVNETGVKPMGVAYPSPTTSFINIPINETLSNDARIQIFDTKGMKCLDSEVGNTGNLITLDAHNLDAGLYVYKVVSGKREVTSGKFVKE